MQYTIMQTYEVFCRMFSRMNSLAESTVNQLAESPVSHFFKIFYDISVNTKRLY